MKAITGCFRTTPTTALEIEAGIQPTAIRLQTKVLQAFTRMKALSATHPIQAHLRNVKQHGNIKYKSNIENIWQNFPQMAGITETIEPYARPPKVGNEPNEPNIRGSLLVSSRTNQHFFARSPQRAERRPDAARSLGERAARLARSARSWDIW